MNSVQRSIFFSAIERYASLLLFFVSIGILSRLLSPNEFGVYAVVLAITSVFSASSQEFGGANYLIQKASLSEGNVRTAFTITFCLSVAVGVVLYLLGGFLGSTLGADGLEAGIAAAACSSVSSRPAISPAISRWFACRSLSRKWVIAILRRSGA
jgi:O-antigen/teichoic acid export membrane protein